MPTSTKNADGTYTLTPTSPVVGAPPAPAPATNTPVPNPVTPPAATPAAAPGPSATGVPDSSFLNLLNGLNTGFQQNNALVDQKNAVMQAVLGNTIDPATLAKLPPDVQNVIKGGNRDALMLQAQVLDDSIQGRNGSVASSIQYLTAGYQDAVKTANDQKQAELDNLMKLASTFVDPTTGKVDIKKAGAAFQALYPGVDMSGVLDQLQGQMPVSEYNKQFYQGSLTQNTPVSGGVGGYDLSTYASNPDYTANVAKIASTMGPISDAASAQNYITTHYPASPITGDMVMTAAQQYGVDPTMIMSVMQAESQLGTDGSKGAKQNNFGNVGNTDLAMANGKPVSMKTPQDGINAVANWLSQHPASPADPTVQSYVDGIKSGTVTSIASVPAKYKSQVINALDKQGVQPPLGDRRYIMASNGLIQNLIALPEYTLTANAQPYLLKIQAGINVPGSVSDQDLLDSYTKLSTAGGVITDAQISVITGGRSLSDSANIMEKKLQQGGILSDDQRQQIAKLGAAVYKNLQAGYQPIYDEAVKKLKGAGIPEQFWTMPDLNSLSSLTQAALNVPDAGGAIPRGSMSASAYVDTVLKSKGVQYDAAVKAVPAGKKGVIDNATGQVGAIDPKEFDPSKYTPL